MLTLPDPTPYDLRFRILGIPVRVHPGFWILMAVIGGAGSSPVRSTLIFIGCALVSLLVHELGHATTMKAFGQWPRIVLYWMGGGAISSDVERRPWKRLLIILAGPAAGFALLLLTLVGASVARGLSALDLIGLCQINLGLRPSGFSDRAITLLREQSFAQDVIFDLIRINLLWTLLNLLPIFPLDGGQAVGAALSLVDPARGPRWMHTISLIVAGLLAVYVFQFGGANMFQLLLLGVFAFQNYQILQMMHHVRRDSFGDDADDWWRR